MRQISLRQCATFSSSQKVSDQLASCMKYSNYFNCGTRKAYPVLYVHDNKVVVDTAQKVVLEKWYITALKIISYLTLILPLTIAVLLWIKQRGLAVQAHLDLLLIIDPVQCYQKLNQEKGRLKLLGISSDRWEEAICDSSISMKTQKQQIAFDSCVDFLISQSLVREEVLFKKGCLEHKSVECVKLLLKRGNISPSVREECLQKAVEFNHLDIVLALCGNDMEQAAQKFIEKIGKADEKQRSNQWRALYRLNPIEIVDQMKERFFSSFHQEIEEVRKDCMLWMPHVSQYHKPRDLGFVERVYQKNDDIALSSVEKDRSYGLRCYDWIQNLLSQYKKNEHIEPQGEEYRKLPAGSKGKRCAAWFTEQIAHFRNLARQGDEVRLRKGDVSYETRIPSERYRWGYILMGRDLAEKHVLFSSYKGKILNAIELSRWNHGREPQLFTWPDIEDTFEKVLHTNPKKHRAQFYDSLIKLVWLIGNTTPLTRGTGSVVEGIWAFSHRYWNCPVPILKKQFPQFDVINLSCNLKNFQKKWSCYFEPSTLKT